MVSALMSRAFSLIGFKGIDDHHVSPPAKIGAALAAVLKPVTRVAFPPAAPVPAALYQCTAWTKPADRLALAAPLAARGGALAARREARGCGRSTRPRPETASR